MDKLEICKRTRQIASNTLFASLQKALSSSKPFSEAEFARVWLENLRMHQDIFSDGWYIPPPHGIGVLFGEVDRDSRQNYKSLRPQEMWPNDQILLGDKNEMLYFYCSPVDRKSGIIGDFGLSIYLGNDKKVKQHLKVYFVINRKIFDFIKVGMSFSQVYDFAETVFKDYGVSNKVTSITDPSGKPDIGHTAPGLLEGFTPDEIATLESNNWQSVSTMISKKRKFVNPVEEASYEKGMAVTLEPRLVIANDAGIPMASFHTIVLIKEDGSKELLTNFEEIFKLVGMDYMLN